MPFSLILTLFCTASTAMTVFPKLTYKIGSQSLGKAIYVIECAPTQECEVRAKEICREMYAVLTAQDKTTTDFACIDDAELKYLMEIEPR